jgi:hypothetical protein
MDKSAVNEVTTENDDVELAANDAACLPLPQTLKPRKCCRPCR